MRRSLLLPLALVAGGLGLPHAEAQSRACLREVPSATYSAASMTATWRINAAPCTAARSPAEVNVEVTVTRCVADACSDTTGKRRCLLKSGSCLVTVVMPHPAAEVAEYELSWTGQATSRGEVTSGAGRTASIGPDPCITAAVVIRDCTRA